MRHVVRAVMVLAPLIVALPAYAQDKPRHGGELIFVVPSEPPTYDGHAEDTFGVVHPLAPHYNTLLRIDPFDKTGSTAVPDLAESWTITRGRQTYTLKLRQGVKFHDGSVMTSRDVKASYDRIEASAYHPMLERGDFEVAMDFQCSFVIEPDIDIEKFQSAGISDRNWGRYKDPVLDELYVKQARATDPDERKRHLRAFEKRLLDEEVHYIYTLQNHRIVAHNSKGRGSTITPAHFLNQQPDTVWLAD